MDWDVGHLISVSYVLLYSHPVLKADLPMNPRADMHSEIGTRATHTCHKPKDGSSIVANLEALDVQRQLLGLSHTWPNMHARTSLEAAF